MPRFILLVSFLFVITNIIANLNGSSSKQENVSSSSKKGGAWGGTPVLAFDPDLGLKYGALINLFDYGDGTVFPDYEQYLFLRLFHSTGGTSNLSLLFESETMVPDSRVTFEASYIKDITLDFFGFNGRNAVYQSAFITPDQSGFKNKFFYKHQRELIRLRLDWQKRISGSNWKMFYGLAWNRYAISDVDFDRLRKNESKKEANSENTTLFKLYQNWDLVSEEEKDGGYITSLSLGFTYDTRNNKINCSDGTWFESYFITSPPAISSSFYLQHIVTYRRYVRSNAINAVLAYRLSSQQLLAGKMPFYALPQYHDTRQDQDGLGGAFNLRGINRNRIAANGFLLGNMEMRKNVFSFNFLKLNWEIDISAFTDFAYITREYKLDVTKVPDSYQNLLFSNKTQKPISSYGGGLYVIYNKNNITSINYGVSPDKQLGSSGLYIGSAFLF